MFTSADHTHTLTSRLRGQRRPPVLLSLQQLVHTRAELPTRKRRRADTVRYLLPERRAVFTGVCLPACLPACAVCLRKSDAVIAPCAADREPLSPPAPPPPQPPPPPGSSLWLAVAAAVRMWSPQRNALHPSASIGEEDEMFFPLSPVPLPPSEHHPVLHLPHRR